VIRPNLLAGIEKANELTTEEIRGGDAVGFVIIAQ
jgi:hypothetical protein